LPFPWATLIADTVRLGYGDDYELEPIDLRKTA
jgi:hypothetical protein